MSLWNKKREKKLTRRKDGTFKNWKGGYKLSEMLKKQNNFQGIAIHIGKEYKRQTGRIAKIGAVVRRKKKDGTFHKGAMWYIRTPKGWRKSPSEFKKPSKAQIALTIKNARTGRK